MSDTSDPIRRVSELVDDANLCMFTTVTSEDRLVSRPMGVQETEFDGDLWFFTSETSNKAVQIGANPRVNVAFANIKDSAWTSITGTAQVVHDSSKAEQLWSAPLKVWFPDGLETEGLVLIRVHAESAEYWDSSSSKTVKLLGAAAAAVTGDPDKFPGSNQEVQL